MSTGPAPDFTLNESRPWYRRNLVVVVVLVLGLLLIGGMYQCARTISGFVREGTGPALRAAERFHSQLNRGEYSQILAGATDEFRKSASEEDLTKFLAAVHRKLGDFLAAGPPAYTFQATTGGNFVVLTYESTFEHGKGTERFTWKMVDGQPRLMGYNIDSRELITN